MHAVFSNQRLQSERRSSIKSREFKCFLPALLFLNLRLFFQHKKKGSLSDILLNDQKDYQKVVAAMQQMGIPKDEMTEIFQVVAGVLHLGNIVFEDAGGSSGKICFTQKIFVS